MKLKVISVTLLAVFSIPTFASDYFLHAQKRDDDDTGLHDRQVAAFQQDAAKPVNKTWAFNKQRSESVFGGIAVNQSNGADLAQINFTNYYIKTGEDIELHDDPTDPSKVTGVKHPLIIPFQLFVSPSVAGSSGTTSNSQPLNQAKLLEPSAGTAIRIPLVWTYLGNGRNTFCYFNQGSNYSCNAGIDFTLSYKSLTATDGTTQTPTVFTTRVGASFTFPVIAEAADRQKSSLGDGYFAGAVKLGYSTMAGGGDSSKLFIPVLDANGKPVQFKKSLATYEVDLALAVNKQFSVIAKRVGPIGGNDYLKPQTVIQFDTSL